MARLIFELDFSSLARVELFAAYDAHEEIEKAIKKAVKKTSLSDFFDGITRIEVTD